MNRYIPWADLSRLRWVSLRAVVCVAAAVGAGDLLAAESNGPGTLLKWGYGEGGEGGPDLDEPIVTDRPDFTESSVTVGRGVVQLELGYTLFKNDDDGVETTSHSYPETLLRVGMFADWFEFRVDWNYATERTETGAVVDTISGAEDLTLGCKIALTGQECILPETAIILQMSVPTGSDEFSSDRVLPGFNYLYGWDLSEDWSLGGSTGLNAVTDDVTNDLYNEFSQSLTIGRAWCENVNSYFEWYMLSPISADTNRPEQYINGGVTVLLNLDLQWDIRAGFGLTGASDDFFAGTGLSMRYF
jgi:hypothetical protein